MMSSATRCSSVGSLLALLIGLGFIQSALGSANFQSQAVQIPILDPSGKPQTLQGLVCRPVGVDKPKLAIINHGSPPNPSDRPHMQPVACNSEAVQWFLDRGYAAVMALRLGYGGSSGAWAEGYGSCTDAEYVHAGLETAREIDVIVNFARSLPAIDPNGVLVVGQSAGGWGTIAYDSVAHPHVLTFINMAGGRGGHYHDRPDNNCHPENLVRAVAQFGKTATTPMLWMYSKNDSFFNPRLAKAMYEAFTQNGGNAQFVAADSYERDGHHVFFGNGGSRIWGPVVERFVDALTTQ